MAVSVLVHITLCMYLPCTSKGWGPLRPRKSLYNSFYCQEKKKKKSPFVGERERGRRRRARDLQGYIVLWLMARAMMVNGFTTVRTTSLLFFNQTHTKNETKKKNVLHSEMSSTQKGKFKKEKKVPVFFLECNFSLFWNL